MSNLMQTAVALLAGLALAVGLGPANAHAASLEPVAKFYAGQTHLDLEVFHASEGGELGLLTIENPLRIRGQPSASIALQPTQWPELIALWAQARAGVTGAEPWTPVGEIVEIDGSPSPVRLSVSSGPDVRFSLGGAVIGLTFELSASDVEAMDHALAREQTLLQSKK